MGFVTGPASQGKWQELLLDRRARAGHDSVRMIENWLRSARAGRVVNGHPQPFASLLPVLVLGLAMLAGPERALGQRPLGIDVSTYDGTAINWASVKSSGIVFAWAKASQGVRIADNTFTINEANAKAAGVVIGAYHFPEYNTNLGTSGADSEADYFWNIAKNYIKGGGYYLMPMLDMETAPSGYTKATLSAWANEWCSKIVSLAAASGVTVKPVIYTGISFASSWLDSTVTQWPLWMAWPSTLDPQTGAPYQTSPWSTWNFWQYSWTGTVPGTSGNCDLDVFNGTSSGLSTYVVAAAGTPPGITSQPVSQTVLAGANVTFTVGASGTAPLSYAWRRNGSAISGATASSFTTNNVQAASAGSYSVLVSNSSGSTNSANAVLVVNSPPAITAQPTDTYTGLGLSAAFGVTATGTSPLSYQWQRNGGTLAGATTNSLTFASAQMTNAGTYTVVVTNSYGSVTSSNAVLSVWPLVAWGRDDYGEAEIPSARLTNVTAIASGLYHNLALRSDGTVAAWGAGATNSGSNPNFGQALVPGGLANVVGIAAGTFHSLAVRADGTVVAWGAGTNNTGSSPQYGQCLVPAGLANVSAVAGGGYHSLALRTDGTVLAWGANSYQQTNVPAGLSNVVAVAAGGYHCLALKADGTVVAWGAGTSNTGSLPNYGQSAVPDDLSNVVAVAAGVYHSLALKADGTVVAWGYNNGGQTNIPGGLTSAVAVGGGYLYSLAQRADGTVLAWGDSTYGQTNIPTGLANVARIAGGGYHELALVSDGRPSLTVQPASQVALAGTTVRLPAMAAGQQPLSWQWQINGTNIAGATTAMLTLTNVQGAAAGAYTLTVSNTVGTAASSNAVLTVLSPPTITGQPSDQTVVAGANVSFTVQADSLAPLSYQWWFDQTNLLASGTAALSLTNVQPASAGDYLVVVGNVAGSVTSAVATLTVWGPAGILSAPIYGADGSFQFNVGGDAGSNYVVACSTNLTDWTPLETNTSPFTFDDTNAVNVPMQFYRAQPWP